VSELEELCDSLNAINGDILQTAQELHTKAQAYNRAAANAAAAARQAEGEAAGALARTAAALSAAAQHCGRAAQSLTGASGEGQAFVKRTVGGSESRGATRGATADGADGLDEADRGALKDYTGSGYHEMNDMLRGKRGFDVDVAQRCTALSTALSKLPDHKGMVTRGTNLTDSQLAAYSKGTVVRERGFTSTDTRKPFDGNTIFFIQSNSGKDVSEYSEFGPSAGGSEREVIFNAGTRFRVISHGIVNGRHRIVLAEV
jgi:hypothetical protein